MKSGFPAIALQESARFVRFGFVGGLGALFGVSSYWFLVALFGDYLGHMLPMFLVVTIWSPIAYKLQAKYVLRARLKVRTFVVSQLAQLVLATPTLWVLLNFLPVPPQMAYALSLLLVALVSFFFIRVL